MKLPYAHLADAPESKVLDYLLCPWHRTGGPKSKFFHSIGFSREHWMVLANALKAHAAAHECLEFRVSQYGTTYRIDGSLLAPNGQMVNVRSVWFIAVSEQTPCLASAYPCPAPNIV